MLGRTLPSFTRANSSEASLTDRIDNRVRSVECLNPDWFRLVPRCPDPLAVRWLYEPHAPQLIRPRNGEFPSEMRRGWDPNPRTACAVNGFEDRGHHRMPRTLERVAEETRDAECTGEP